MKQVTKNQLRCFCGHKTLLAVYGVDENQNLYIHIKVFKQDRIFMQVLIREGTPEIQCRDCLRWHTVRIVPRGKPVLEEATPPPEIAVTP